jgi:putative heme-binding domain-containing protein
LSLGGKSFSELKKLPNVAGRKQIATLPRVFSAARSIAGDDSRPDELRVAAARLLGHAPEDAAQDAATLSELLSPQTPNEVQTAAVAALGRLDRSKAIPILLSHWKALTPPLRSQLVESFLSQPAGMAAILDAIQQGDIAPRDIPLTARQRLLSSPDRTVAERAQRVFAERLDPNREKVVQSHLSVAKLQGNAVRGIQLFAKNCSSCHQLGVVGAAVGPNLAMTQDKPSDWFLTAILDPSRAVDAKYLSYTVLTASGTTLVGVPAEESGTSMTLVDAQGKRHDILRSEIELISSTNKSLMPEGFENQLSKQDLADVIAFVKAPHPAAKAIEFNQPQIVLPAADGSLQLTAANGEVFGNEIHIWDRYQCLSWWTSDEDKVQWTVQAPTAGEYAISMEWSCDDGSAGNRWQIDVNGEKLRGAVKSSGGWETYRNENVGAVNLPEGLSQITVRPAGPMRTGTHLFDLRGLALHSVEQK